MTRLQILRRHLHLALAISILVWIASLKASDLDPCRVYLQAAESDQLG